MNTTFLTMSRYSRKVYEQLESAACSDYGLTLMEMDILLFLANNPEYVTAQDIVEYRMLAKSHVSISVDRLLKRGFLIKASAQKRNIPLALTPEGMKAVEAGRKMQALFQEILIDGFDEEEAAQLQDFQRRISKNLMDAYKRYK